MPFDVQEGVLPWPVLMPVVKADAYGHGAIPAARALVRAGATALCSGSVEEAVALREGLGAEGRKTRIVSLLGLISTGDARLAERHDVIPVLHCFEQLEFLEGRALRVAVKCDSGMTRLGFSEEELPELAARLRAVPAVRPVLLLSHLASADMVDDGGVMSAQTTAFARMSKGFRELWPDMALSLGNSAGTFRYGEICRSIGPHVCRPGLALYGGNPFFGTSLEARGVGMLPAMEVHAPILTVRDAPVGRGIGYAHSCVIETPTRVAVVAAGYADGFSRGLSGKGEMCVNGRRAPILGRVSMQMTAVDVTAIPGTKPGDRAWLMGGPAPNAVTVEELAAAWGTIPYEVLCLMGGNVRHYTGPAQRKS